MVLQLLQLGIKEVNRGGFMRCSYCENKKELKKSKTNYRYKEAGLDNIVLKGITVVRCDNCGEEYYNFGDIEQLHDKIAEILLTKAGLLTGKEIRFLRKHIGYSGAMFARLTGYTSETISRLENGQQKVTKSFDRMLRFVVISKLPKKDRCYDLHDIILNDSGNKLTRIELKKTDKGCWEEKIAA